MRKRLSAFLLCLAVTLSLLPLPAMAVTTNEKKIYLSPSDQTDNRYAYGDTTEAIECRRIADALEIALVRNGFQVKNNQTESMKERVEESDAWGADLHVPLHTNAYNGEVGGTRIYTYDTSGKGWQCARKVYDYLAPLTPGTSDNMTADASLYEIRVPAAPTVYIESEFHDVPENAKWIIENTENIAEAICQGICSYFDVAYVPVPEKSEQTITADDINVTCGGTDISVAAFTDGDGTLTYEVIDGIDVVSVDNDGRLTILKEGTATIRITASATESYNMAAKDITVTVALAQQHITVGDVNGDGEVTDADAVHLLYYTFFGDEEYPLNQPCDFNGDGEVTDADAVYLLYYTFFGAEEYPLY